METKGLKERHHQGMDANMENMLYKTQLRGPRNYQVPLKEEKEPLSVKESIEQPIDLQSCSSHQDTLEDTPSEQSILDLSCKKTFLSPTYSSKNDVPDAIQTNEELSTTNEENVKIRKRKYNNSPFERHYFMFTPPSESESPKKIKFEENPLNVLAMNNNIEKLSHLPINVPVPVISTMLPTLLPANSMEEEKEKINTNIQLPTTTTINLFPHDSPKKMPRPFKAYPLALSTNPPDLIYTEYSGETYSEFRERMLVSVRRQNESSNPKMRRNNKTLSSVSPTSTVEEKDAAYWERRKKNNEAAKRSRDARRAKEDEIAIRAAFLEQENMKLKYELATLRTETAKLKCMIYST